MKFSNILDGFRSGYEVVKLIYIYTLDEVEIKNDVVDFVDVVDVVGREPLVNLNAVWWAMVMLSDQIVDLWT